VPKEKYFREDRENKERQRSPLNSETIVEIGIHFERIPTKKWGISMFCIYQDLDPEGSRNRLGKSNE
jgi:hypothetical protein